MTTQIGTPTGPVMPREIHTPNLPAGGATQVWSAANLHQSGQPIFVSCTYRKQTTSKPRIAPRDYVALPGVAMDAQMGPITSVFRRKGDNAVRINIWSITRQKHTCIIPEGLTAFTMMPIPEEMLQAMLPRQAQQPQPNVQTGP